MHPPLYNVISKNGNKKVPKSTAIFNMTTAHNCPSMKLGLCKAAEQGAKCYAKKAEYLYPMVLPYRKRQEKFWKKVSAKEFANQFMAINAVKHKKFNALRLNESGDFNSQECVDKAENIARILEKNGIITYLYTSRSDLDYRKVKALRISGSNFKLPGITNVFKIIKHKENLPNGWGMCAMNCRICHKCFGFNQLVCVIKH